VELPINDEAASDRDKDDKLGIAPEFNNIYSDTKSAYEDDYIVNIIPIIDEEEDILT
jgi:hypothetical protein